MTIHRSKGLEFARVLIFGMGASEFPSKYLLQNTPEEELADVMLRQRSLLYVGATRARDHLAIAFRGEQTSLLPAAVA